MHRIRAAAVVFDCDGLLVDTASCWEAAYRAALGRRGRELTPELLGRLNGASVRIAADLLDVDSGEIGRDLEEAVATTRLEPIPGVRDLLEHLGASRPLAVATNGPERVARIALGRVGIEDRFAAVVSAESRRDKPEPDVYLAAAAALGAEPRDAIAFEDSLLGATAASAAGIPLVFVPSRGDSFPDAILEVSRIDDPRVLDLLPRTVASAARGRHAPRR